jgi:hypothetical protein
MRPPENSSLAVMVFASLASLLLLSTPIRAQSIPAVLHKKSNLEELKAYYRERLVEIKIVATNKQTNLEEVIRGTGFLVSSDGLVVTARHVIEPALNRDTYKLTRNDAIQLGVHVGFTVVPVTWVPETAILSKQADIAIFKITSDGGKSFPYVCIDKTDPGLTPDERMTLSSFRYEGRPYDHTDFTFTSNVIVTHPAGPGNMFRYIGLAQPIEPSMSGGALVRERNDRVIAVMSNVLANADGTEQKGENYANLLQSATDIGLDAISPCASAIAEGHDIRQVKSDQEFMSSTCEGTVAWVPSGSDERWVFDTSGNYNFRRRDLAACSIGKNWKLMRLAINTNPNGACDNSPRTTIPTSVATFYGIQLVPVFLDGVEDSVEQQTWLFRIGTLFGRRKDGAFFIPTGRHSGQLEKKDGTPPSAYNQGVKSASAILSNRPVGCQSISAAACADILAVQGFARALNLKNPWHGFVRNASGAQSTLSSAGPDWIVRDGWLKKGADPSGNDLQLKSWILRYRGTTSPVPFEFCIAPEWSEFHLRAFSPERRVEPELLHVFLSD